MNRASTYLARAIVWVVVWVPIDRTVCRWTEVTHQGRSS